MDTFVIETLFHNFMIISKPTNKPIHYTGLSYKKTAWSQHDILYKS